MMIHGQFGGGFKGLPLCVATQATRPITNREARVSGLQLA
jgi:hypothetical protein